MLVTLLSPDPNGAASVGLGEVPVEGWFGASTCSYGSWATARRAGSETAFRDAGRGRLARRCPASSMRSPRPASLGSCTLLEVWTVVIMPSPRVGPMTNSVVQTCASHGPGSRSPSQPRLHAGVQRRGPRSSLCGIRWLQTGRQRLRPRARSEALQCRGCRKCGAM